MVIFLQSFIICTFQTNWKRSNAEFFYTTGLPTVGVGHYDKVSLPGSLWHTVRCHKWPSLGQSGTQVDTIAPSLLNLPIILIITPHYCHEHTKFEVRAGVYGGTQPHTTTLHHILQDSTAIHHTSPACKALRAIESNFQLSNYTSTPALGASLRHHYIMSSKWHHITTALGLDVLT